MHGARKNIKKIDIEWGKKINYCNSFALECCTLYSMEDSTQSKTSFTVITNDEAMNCS
jgi:hypothetical protein